MKKYKYVHVLWRVDSGMKFYPGLLQLINSGVDGIDPDDHLFITTLEDVYNAFRSYDNVEFFPSKRARSNNVVWYSLTRGYWVILHGIEARLLLVKPGDLKRMIWRTWGADAHVLFSEKDAPLFKRIIKKLAFPLFMYLHKKAIRGLYAVGIANIVDQIDIETTFGVHRFYYLSYAALSKNSLYEQYESIKQKVRVTGDPLNVLIGHSGFWEDNHIAILQEFEKCKLPNTKFHLVLSYGKPSYIEKIKEFVSNNRTLDIEVHENFMPLNEYIIFLNEMDAAVMDGLTSYALGNINALLHYKKTIILNRHGVIAKAFDAEGIPYICSDDIASLTYSVLDKGFDYSLGNSTLRGWSEDERIANWKKLFQDLDSDACYSDFSID